MEDGQHIGTLTKAKTAAGYTYRFEDMEGRLQTLEYRQEDKSLVEGMCTLRYEYDAQGRQILARAFDRNDDPARTEACWNEQRTSFSSTAAGHQVIEHQFCLSDGELTATPAGFAVKRIEFGEDPKRPERLDFFGTEREPVGTEYRGQSGVFSVTFAYLQGLQPICMAALHDDSKAVLARVKISGSSHSVTVSNTNGAYGYYGQPYNAYYGY
ncbi:MAG: hypothetical protein ACI8QS_003433 [Planctomycetota bacterium]|jgi:hypothetical protein